MKKLYFLTILLLILESAAGQVRIRSTAEGGNWSCSCTWHGGIVPEAVDTVEIIGGSTVVIDSAEFAVTKVGRLELSGTLLFGVNEPLVVEGSLIINSGGVFNAYNGNTGALVTINGDLLNNGTANFSKTGCVLSMGESGTLSRIYGTGTYGILRQLNISNTKNVNLEKALSISNKLELNRGILFNTMALTLDQTVVGSGTTSTSCTIQRSPKSSLSNAITIPAATALYLSYMGLEGEGVITEGYEIPVSRSVHKIVVNNPDGVLINNDLTLKTASAAITLTSGVLTVAAGKTLICNNSGFPGTAGGYNCYVEGGVALIVNATGGTKTFPVGAQGRNRKVVLNDLSAASGTLLVRFAVVPASGGTGVDSIILSDQRRFYGSIVSGTLGKFTGMSVDYWDDDALQQANGILAISPTLSAAYNSLGAGINTASAIVCVPGVYNTTTTATLPAYFALATPGSSNQRLAATKAQSNNLSPVKNQDEPAGVKLRIYPNPTQGELNVKSTGLKGHQVKLVIVAVDGNVIYRGNTTAAELENGYRIDLRNLRVATGVYFLQVSSDAQMKYAKFLVL